MAELRQANWERFNKALGYTNLGETRNTVLKGPTVRYYVEKGAFSAGQFLTMSDASLHHLQSKDIQQVIEQGEVNPGSVFKIE